MAEFGGYLALWLREWVWGVKHSHKIDLEVVEREGKGFQVVPYRWVVERTFAWLLNYRRHRCDYERGSRSNGANMCCTYNVTYIFMLRRTCKKLILLHFFSA